MENLANVKLVLRDANTNAIIATTTTDLNGEYEFSNYPPGDYIVDVMDDDELENYTFESKTI